MGAPEVWVRTAHCVWIAVRTANCLLVCSLGLPTAPPGAISSDQSFPRRLFPFTAVFSLPKLAIRTTPTAPPSSLSAKDPRVLSLSLKLLLNGPEGGIQPSVWEDGGMVVPQDPLAQDIAMCLGCRGAGVHHGAAAGADGVCTDLDRIQSQVSCPNACGRRKRRSPSSGSCWWGTPPAV